MNFFLSSIRDQWMNYVGNCGCVNLLEIWERSAFPHSTLEKGTNMFFKKQEKNKEYTVFIMCLLSCSKPVHGLTNIALYYSHLNYYIKVLLHIFSRVQFHDFFPFLLISASFSLLHRHLMIEFLFFVLCLGWDLDD